MCYSFIIVFIFFVFYEMCCKVTNKRGKHKGKSICFRTFSPDIYWTYDIQIMCEITHVLVDDLYKGYVNFFEGRAGNDGEFWATFHYRAMR